MIIVTTNDIAGYEIRRVHGEVFGLTVRSRNIGSQIGAGFKSLKGGELRGMTENMINSRNEVMGRMVYDAQSRGANAIVAMRFDSSEMGGTWTEVVAYGTAVTVVPVTDEAKQQVQEQSGQWHPNAPGGQPPAPPPGTPGFPPGVPPGQPAGPPPGQPGYGPPGYGPPPGAPPPGAPPPGAPSAPPSGHQSGPPPGPPSGQQPPLGPPSGQHPGPPLGPPSGQQPGVPPS